MEMSRGPKISPIKPKSWMPMMTPKMVINLIKNGTCLFIYHPSKSYLHGSRILNGWFWTQTRMDDKKPTVPYGWAFVLYGRLRGWITDFTDGDLNTDFTDKWWDWFLFRVGFHGWGIKVGNLSTYLFFQPSAFAALRRTSQPSANSY